MRSPLVDYEIEGGTVDYQIHHNASSMNWNPLLQILMAYVVLVILGILPNPLNSSNSNCNNPTSNNSSFISRFVGGATSYFKNKF
jgi:hypothetical protein